MEAQRTPFRRGFSTLQTSLTLPELPPRAPAYAVRRFVSLCFGRVFLGEVFGVWAGGANSLHGAASHPICRQEAFGDYALRKCRDSERIPLTKRARQPHSAKNSYLPNQQKNFPHVPAILKKRIKVSPCKWRGHEGSSGWVREVWRVGRAPFKGSPCASKVFLPVPFLTPPHRHPTRGRTSRLRDPYR